MPKPKLKGDDGDESADEEPAEEEIELDGGQPDGDGDDEEAETEETGEEQEEEDPDLEEVEMPEDDNDVEKSGGGLLSGSTFGVSNKLLLGMGIAAIVVVVLLMQAEEQNASLERYDEETVEDELEEGSDGAIQEAQSPLDAGGSSAGYSEAQQEAAIESVFDKG